MNIAEQVGKRLAERGEWAPRMAVEAGFVARVEDGWLHFGGAAIRADAAVPDLTDWATLGVLIGVISSKRGRFPANMVGRVFSEMDEESLWAVLDFEPEAIGALYLAVTEPAP